MVTRLPVVSRYLERFWNGVLAQRGWNAKQLATAAGVSYGYTRRIVNGTLIPSRDALRRLCATTGQHFLTVWTSLHQEQQHEEPYEKGLNISTAAISGEDLDSLNGPTTDAIRKRLLDLFDQLPLEGRLHLLEEAWRSNEMYKVTKKW